MIGRHRQVKRITTGIGRHHLVLDVCLHDFGNSGLNRQQRQVAHKRHPLLISL